MKIHIHVVMFVHLHAKMNTQEIVFRANLQKKPGLLFRFIYLYRCLVYLPTLQIIKVTAFPPRLSCSNRVNVESRYGTCRLLPFFFFILGNVPSLFVSELVLSPPLPAVNALTTFPNADKLLLMALPSFKRSPVAPVFDCLSLPAKSMRDSFDLMVPKPECPLSVCSIHKVNTACEREDASFIFVFALVRLENPRACVRIDNDNR